MFERRRLMELAGIDDAGSSDAAPRKQRLNEAACEPGDDDCEQLDEVRVRNIIRKEIRSMLERMNADDKRSWILKGQRPSSNSQPGQVARGFFGPGFRRF